MDLSGTVGGFWRHKRVLLTGHTGFKGGWLSLWLHRLEADVVGIGLFPSTVPNLFEIAHVKKNLESHYCDIRDATKLASIIKGFRPEIIFHLAAQPLVHAGYQDPLGTYGTNVMGTANLLDALRGLDTAKVVVMVTTDKVYRNNEWVFPYRESDALGGHDPYSASKAASEMVIASYRDAYLLEQGVAVSSARAGNVIGGGDWSQNRLIPDAVRSWRDGVSLEIRRPQAIRPWQHVLEPLHGYLTLAKKLWFYPSLAGAYNFGPHPYEAATVREVIELARSSFGRGEINYCNDKISPHESVLLALETAKSRDVLGIAPKWSLSEAVNRTMNWYSALDMGQDALELCNADISIYEGFK
jgi:CDP-glucose 4,6-dehydratase